MGLFHDLRAGVGKYEGNRKLLLPLFLRAGLRFLTFTFFAGFLFVASGFAFSTARFSFLLPARRFIAI